MTLSFAAEHFRTRADSPFFRETQLQMAWDQTSLGLLMECPRKYQLTIQEGWRGKGSSVHLKFGGHYADAMQRFHQARAAGSDFEAALDEVIGRALCDTVEYVENEAGEITCVPWDSNDTKKNRETLIRSIIWYFDSYQNDEMETVILPDGRPAVELLFTFESGLKAANGQQFLMTGHLDRLVQFDGTKFVMDQKTTGGALGTYYFSQFDLDNQMSQYTFAGQVCYNMPIKGVVIDAAQIMVGFTAFGRGITTRSSAQLQEWHANAGVWLGLAERFAETNQYPMNLKSCNNYSGCVFKGVCGQSPTVRQNFLETSFERRLWNPLEVRD